MLTILDITLISLAFYCSLRLAQRLGTSRIPLPPGPTGWPLIGNLLEYPSERAWEAFSRWAEVYGPVFCLSMFGQKLVIVNDVETAIDILDKSGGKIADRAQTTMLTLSGWDMTLVVQPYGASSRAYRKLMFKLIGTWKLMKRFHPMEERRSNALIMSLVKRPDEIARACRTMTGSVSLEAAFGYTVRDDGSYDAFVDLAETSVAEFSRLGAAGVYIADLIPWLRFVPAWFPGAGFQREAVAAKQRLHQLADQPVQFVKEQLAKNEPRMPSLTGDMMEAGSLTEEEFTIMKNAAVSFYGGAADTSVGSLLVYFVAMMLYPEVQAKLQAEVDQVVGADRLPSFEDRESMPYSEAVMKELFRWMPVIPTGIPHLVSEDYLYKGYVIPKGALVLPNIWAMMHDPNVYHEPSTFNPDRFMGENPEQDPTTACFGFGRRICPGQKLADATIWISIVKFALALQVNAPLNESGEPIKPEVAQTSGIISHPVPFKCDVKSRSERVVRLVEESLEHQTVH